MCGQHYLDVTAVTHFIVFDTEFLSTHATVARPVWKWFSNDHWLRKGGNWEVRWWDRLPLRVNHRSRLPVFKPTT